MRFLALPVALCTRPGCDRRYVPGPLDSRFCDVCRARMWPDKQRAQHDAWRKEGEMYARVMRMQGLTVTQVAALYGKARATIEKRLEAAR